MSLLDPVAASPTSRHGNSPSPRMKSPRVATVEGGGAEPSPPARFPALQHASGGGAGPSGLALVPACSVPAPVPGLALPAQSPFANPADRACVKRRMQRAWSRLISEGFSHDEAQRRMHDDWLDGEQPPYYSALHGVLTEVEAEAEAPAAPAGQPAMQAALELVAEEL